jgi:5S rRNA maturation endonuclease (ribonuclease M5)
MGSKDTSSEWITTWLDGVVSGKSTMSQRSLSTVGKRGSSIAEIKKAAKSRGVHLLLLKDDNGKELLAASMEPFKVIC